MVKHIAIKIKQYEVTFSLIEAQIDVERVIHDIDVLQLLQLVR